MGEKNTFTTIIVHDIRIRLGLSCNEYCVADLIDWSAEEEGFCSLSRQEIAVMLGITKQAIVKILERLIRDALVYKNEHTKKLCTTDLWKDNFSATVDRYDHAIVNAEKVSTFISPQTTKEGDDIYSSWKPSKAFTPFTN